MATMCVKRDAMMCGIDSLRILRPLRSAHDESTVEEAYGNDGHSEHPELEGDENDIYEGV